MNQIPVLYLALGILTISCGATLVFIGMTRIISRRVIGEIKNEASKK
jgi:hypothetical protein